MLTPHLIAAEEEYWQLRAFLRAIFLLAGRRNLAWHVQRLDYWRWHVLANVHGLPLDGQLALWEDGDGRIIAAITCEDPGEACLHLHPSVASGTILAEMIRYAEQHFFLPRPDGTHALTLWAHAQDRARQDLYAARGYTRGLWPESQWSKVLADSSPAPVPPQGYRLRALGGADELPARSWVSWRAFHPDEPDSAYEGWEWYRSIQRMPLYRRDLDLVAEAGDGTLAAFCTVWYDDVTRCGYFEPVGVAPEHQRRGLGRALLLEGIRRLRMLGATLALVSGYSAEANALYELVMGSPPARYERWQRTWR